MELLTCVSLHFVACIQALGVPKEDGQAIQVARDTGAFGASGAATSSPATPTHGSNPSISSMNSRFTHGANSSVSSITSVTSVSNMGPGSVNQQRRLAEFATVLGDYKLAVSVWEALRKEARGGSVRVSPPYAAYCYWT